MPAPATPPLNDADGGTFADKATDAVQWGWAQGLRYGLLGLPLAFVALPLYVHLPNIYATRFGVPLATLGAVLLLARLLDAITDPLLGHLADRLYARSPQWVLAAGAGAAALLLAGMVVLFFPPDDQGGSPGRLLAGLLFTYAAFSLLTIAHQSWGARLGGTEPQRARLVAWREGAALVGVVLASVLPTWLDWAAWLTVFGIALALGCIAWRSGRVPPAAPRTSDGAGRWRKDMLAPWRHAPFRKLMGVFVLSGMASAMPATLVLFFVQDRLRTPQLEPLFLATYFVCAAASLPLWLRAVARWGLARTWLAGMLLSVGVFAWAATLGAGDVVGFWWVCALSGVALGTDLALPGALLAGMIADRGDRGLREGAYFGWWNLASKFNLAVAAGLALPLLELMGYRPGNASPDGLNALTVAYAILPCAIKLLAACALYAWFVRAPRSLVSNSPHPQEAP